MYETSIMRMNGGKMPKNIDKTKKNNESSLLGVTTPLQSLQSNKKPRLLNFTRENTLESIALILFIIATLTICAMGGRWILFGTSIFLIIGCPWFIYKKSDLYKKPTKNKTTAVIPTTHSRKGSKPKPKK